MKLVRNFVALALFTSALSGGAVAHAADKLVITMDTPPTHLRTRIINDFAQRVGKKSGGELTFEIFDSGQLFSSRDALKAVARGDAGMAVLVTPYLSRVVPDYNIFDLPTFNGMTDEQRAAMLDKGLGAALSKQLEDKLGVVVPGKYWSMGKVFLYSTKKPLNGFADLSGMKVRIPGGAALVMRLETVGAKAVSIPGGDVPLALQQGVVDATMGGPDYIFGNKMWESGLRHGFWDGGIVGFLAPIVSKKYWASLSDKQQTIFRETWNEVAVEQRKAVLAEEAANVLKLENNGIRTVNATADDVAQANKKMMVIQDAMIAKLKISGDIVKLARDAAK